VTGIDPVPRCVQAAQRERHPEIARPLWSEAAKEIVADLSRWHMHVPAADDVLGAMGIHQRGGPCSGTR
jgi:hypothetical protein